jgi:hypothetical protein
MEREIRTGGREIMKKRFLNLESSTGYDGYDDYLNAVTFDYRGDLDEDDYDPELDVPEYERV